MNLSASNYQHQTNHGTNSSTLTYLFLVLRAARHGCTPDSMPADSSTRLCFGPFRVDLHTRELWKHGTRLKLSGQPFEILAILLASPGELVTREELRDRLWRADTFVDFDHGLNAAINKLRDTLCDSVDSPRYIETLPRRGYRFIAEIEAPPPTRQPTIAPASLLATANPVNPLLSDAPPPPSSNVSRPYLVAIILGACVFLTATLVLQKVTFTANRHDSFLAVQRIQPLTNLSDENSEPAFAPSGNYVAFHRTGSSSDSTGIFVQTIGSEELLQLTHNPDDGFPAWSPDSRLIAYTRETKDAISIYIISFAPSGPASTLATSQRQLDTGSFIPTRREIAWSPDGQSLAFSTAAGLVLLSPENSDAHALTHSPASSQDWGPAFSPSGDRLLFVRSDEAAFNDEILSIPVFGGEPSRIASAHASVLGPPQWSNDGKSILFASNRGSHPGLWRVSATTPDTPIQINDSGWYPALARNGNRLAYQRITRKLDIWQIDVGGSNHDPRALIASTSETDQGPGPQVSPDGHKIAFMSDHSGAMEIWVSDRDGAHRQQLTSVGNAGTPRWSPDSQSLVFDVGQRNGTAIYSVNSSGGSPRALIPSDSSNNVCPSFSYDGKWVYFASTRSGSFQVWKVPAEGGTPVQVTQHGGHAALASLDGKFIYYAKTPYANPEIWQVPTKGGPEKLVSPVLNPVTWAAWSITKRGIVFAHPSGRGRPVVSLFDPATRHVSDLAELPIPPFWLSASPDAHFLLFDQPGWQQAQIMLVDNFR